MAFINKEDPVVLNIMLTSKGRERLSTGNLTFNYFTIGDSEIDYNFIRNVEADPNSNYSAFNSNILRPKDLNPSIISYIPQNITGSSFNNIETLSTLSYDVINTTNELGFFTDSGTTYITEATHIKRAGLYVEVSGLTGGTSVNVYKLSTSTQGILEPDVNDYIYIRWAYSGSSTGNTVNSDIPIPNLTYKIVGKTGTLGTNTLVLELDRNLPDLRQLGFSGYSGAMIFYSGLSETNIMPSDYLEESVINFLSNYQCGIANYPFWNMSIVFTEEIAGIQVNDRKFTQFNTKGYGGFVSYIQNQAPLYKKLGIIHYSNNSPANTYGEELRLKTPRLNIPTIMWHKSTSNTLGLTLVATGSSKLLTGDTKSLNIGYYDLADEDSGIVVGKVFNGLKLFVIEDQELLYAMSYKSNRSWTLPNFIIGTAGSNSCGGTTAYVSTPALYTPTQIQCNEIDLVWSTSTSTSGAVVTYVLYRKDNVNDVWSIVDNSITGTTYNQSGLSANMTYYYKVLAVDANGILSDDSNIVGYTVTCVSQPTTPTMNDIELGSACDEFYLSWTPSTDDFPPITYSLYRMDSTDPKWNSIADGLETTDYTDSELTNGVTYTYKVIAYDSNGIPSVESNEVDRTVDCD